LPSLGTREAGGRRTIAKRMIPFSKSALLAIEGWMDLS
jgi:hypothetical protein